ncbi:hypothetical protein Tco_0377337 [Tanacetum coccineum]
MTSRPRTCNLTRPRLEVRQIGNQIQGYREPECGITVPLVYSFGDIPTIIPSTSVVAPETSTIAPVNSSTAPVVETTLVASPTGLCSLVPYSGSYSDSPDEILCYPLRRALRRSEAFHCWCAASLSTLYPPTTSESSSGDSSERPLHASSHSAGPSHKIFQDSYSSEASIEEDTEIDPIETRIDIELGIGDGDDVRDHVEILKFS